MAQVAVKYIDSTKYNVRIHSDDDMGMGPREWDNLGTMICSHRNYNLGDEQFNVGDYDSLDELEQYLRDERGAVVVLPLNLYDHSGITMSIGWGSGWDNGVVGFIYATREDIQKEYGVKNMTKKTLELVERVLAGEVETYDMYLRGDVYGVIIEDEAGQDVGSCWGFYGDAAVEDYLTEVIPDALPENVNIRGVYPGSSEEYETYISYKGGK